MNEVFLAAPVRTAIGRFGGSLKDVPATELGRIVVCEALERAQLRPEQVEAVIFGQARLAGQGPNPARQIAVRAGLPVETTAFTVNAACGSGMKAIELGAQAIRCGDQEIVVVGGMESQSRIPYLLDGARWGYRLGNAVLVDAQYRDGVFCPLSELVMGEGAEELADLYAISRQEQDAYAARSQNRAERAIRSGDFKDEIVSVDVIEGKKDPVAFDTDEHPRFGTTVEKLASLRPYFRENGTVTVGNSSGINDGAACMVLLSGQKVTELGVPVLAKVVDCVTAGVEPRLFGLGPVPAIHKLFSRTGTSMQDYELIEINEAFAAQVIACDRELGLPMDRLNVNGGAVALGHPVGASGARIVVTLLHAMRRRGAQRGLASLCASGGLGLAVAVEMI